MFRILLMLLAASALFCLFYYLFSQYELNKKEKQAKKNLRPFLLRYTHLSQWQIFIHSKKYFAYYWQLSNNPYLHGILDKLEKNDFWLKTHPKSLFIYASHHEQYQNEMKRYLTESFQTQRNQEQHVKFLLQMQSCVDNLNKDMTEKISQQEAEEMNERILVLKELDEFRKLTSWK